MFKPLNQLNAIFDSILDLNLSGNEQLVLLHLYDVFNRSHWTESLKLSDENLRLRLNQYDSTGKPITIETVRRAKQKLKSKGLIDFTSGKGSQISEYRLVKLCKETPCQHPDKPPDNLADNSPANTPDDTALLSIPYNKAVQEDVKTEDGGTHARERTAPAIDDSEKYCSSVIKNAWITNSGMNPNDGICMKLGMLEQNFGTEKVKVAIEEANARNQSGTINFNFVQSVLMRMINGTLTKGVKSNGTTKNHRDETDDWSQYNDL